MKITTLSFPCVRLSKIPRDSTFMVCATTTRIEAYSKNKSSTYIVNKNKKSVLALELGRRWRYRIGKIEVRWPGARRCWNKFQLNIGRCKIRFLRRSWRLARSTQLLDVSGRTTRSIGFLPKLPWVTCGSFNPCHSSNFLYALSFAIIFPVTSAILEVFNTLCNRFN